MHLGYLDPFHMRGHFPFLRYAELSLFAQVSPRNLCMCKPISVLSLIGSEAGVALRLEPDLAQLLTSLGPGTVTEAPQTLVFSTTQQRSPPQS